MASKWKRHWWKNHIVNESGIEWWLYPYYFIRTILSIPFCPCHFVRYHFVLEPETLSRLSDYVWSKMHNDFFDAGITKAEPTLCMEIHWRRVIKHW